MIKVWSLFTTQSKHVVLTARNDQFITRKRLRFYSNCIVKLCRRKLMQTCTGGTCSMEITNEGRGWHVHFHLLLDIRWLGSGELAKVWGKLVGQDFAIVKVKDARGTDYSREVAKYVCKGSDISSWSGDEIWQFICAVRGIRFFRAFGSVLAHKQEVEKILNASKKERPACECGSKEFVFEDEVRALLNQIKRETGRRK